MGGLICGSMVGHFWTFLLKPPQPLMGLFFMLKRVVLNNDQGEVTRPYTLTCIH